MPFKRRWIRSAVDIVTLLLAIGFAVDSHAQRQRLITPNFSNTDIRQVAETTNGIIDKKVVIDPKTGGLITIFCDEQLTPETYFFLLLETFRANGFKVEVGLDTVSISHPPEAQSELLATKPERASVAVYVVSTRKFGADQTKALAQPLLSSAAKISDYPPGQLLIIADSPENIQRLKNYLQADRK
jgi:type II secretory pathway component GspD/PulD (secretin)